MQNCLKLFDDSKENLDFLKGNIENTFKDPSISYAVHAIKSRIKDRRHLEEKIERKIAEGKKIDEETFFNEITDLVGIRILMLYPQYFIDIHKFIKNKINLKEWELKEEPILYTWDEDVRRFFEEHLSFKHVEFKKTLYTSVHYVIRKINGLEKSNYCEIQVRTLFEEAFGEIDHDVNYPHLTTDETLQAQLKALSKMMSAASKQAESIFLLSKSREEKTSSENKLERRKEPSFWIKIKNIFSWY